MDTSRRSPTFEYRIFKYAHVKGYRIVFPSILFPSEKGDRDKTLLLGEKLIASRNELRLVNRQSYRERTIEPVNVPAQVCGDFLLLRLIFLDMVQRHYDSSDDEDNDSYYGDSTTIESRRSKKKKRRKSMFVSIIVLQFSWSRSDGALGAAQYRHCFSRAADC